jgi:DNA (cytosine-5)-methyltransferase 1
MYRLLDLFSGIGGFSLGLERSGGFKTVAFCEIEEFPRRVLRKHWPDVPIYNDIRELTAERLTADGITVDAICGGFPCQDISVAGKGAGIEGERSGLWKEFARLIGELRPKYVIVENVAALLSRGLGTVLGDLAALGYDAEWHCIPASALGACHRRDRLWIIVECSKVRAQRQAKSRKPVSFGEGIKRMVRGWNAGLYPDAWEKRGKRRGIKSVYGLRELSWGQNCGSIAELISVASLHTPALCRSNDGISRRLDRVGAIGNAVVPQISEIIGRAIMEHDTATESKP